MKTEHRAIVLGQGGIGSAAAYWLSLRHGGDVLAADRFGPGHDRGGSQDHSRIIRRSYHDAYHVRLAKLAFETWRAVERASGRDLVVHTGGLDLAPAGGAIDPDDYTSALGEVGVPFRHLTAAEVRQEWPQWRLPDNVSGIHCEEAGAVLAAIANSTHLDLADGRGVHRLWNQPVTGIRELSDGVEVTIGGITHRAESLVVAAGAWTNQVLGLLGLNLPLDVTLEQVVYTNPDDPSRFRPDRFPVWIWLDEPCFYGFPTIGEPAVKIGWDRCKVSTDPDNRPMEPDPATTAAMTDFLDRHLPGSHTGVRYAKTCLYTLTPDRDFIIGAAPDSNRIFMAVGAGHAFKFASLIGRFLAELADGVEPAVDLTRFRADRDILRMADPPRIRMV